MTPAEIGHRVVQAAAIRAERWGLSRCVVPAADLSRRAAGWIETPLAVDREAYRGAAERIVAGRYDVFALKDVELGSPPPWNRDPRSGIEAPLAFGKQLDYRDPGLVGDCKYLWEPNRHLELVTLAQAHALTGDDRFIATLRRHLDDWFASCPFRLGPNWASALEPALRLVNWALAWQLVGGLDSPLFEGEEGARFRDRWLTSVFQHAEFVRGHFSLHSSANNHLIGEAAGVFTAGLAWPHWDQARVWEASAREILEREALLQNAPDGVNREQAVSYQQFCFDLLLLPLLAARANGRPFSSAYAGRLERMLEYVASIMDVKGNLPMFGDADDAYVVRLDPKPGFCRYRSLLATGAILFGRGDFKSKAGGLDDKTRWLLGAQGTQVFDAIDPRGAQLPVRREFRDGGYYILGDRFETSGEVRLVADAGALGYQTIAAHGHADALSFTLSMGGDEVFVDPGTYAYHTQSEWRAYFRGTAAHNTIRVDALDQSVPGGNFMWLRKAAARCTRFDTSEERDLFEGTHDGYTRLADPVTHTRRIVLDKGSRTLEVEDTLAMKGEHEVEIFFHLGEKALVRPIDGGFEIRVGARNVRIRWPEDVTGESALFFGSVDPKAGWVSRGYDMKVPAPTLRWRARISGDRVLRTRVELA